jgi:hypothetical protein
MAYDVDAQQAGHRAARRSIRILDVGEDREASPIIGIALHGRLDVPGGPIEQLHAEPPLQILDGRRGSGTRDSEIGRCSTEATAIDDADEEFESDEPVYIRYSIMQNNDVRICALI